MGNVSVSQADGEIVVTANGVVTVYPVVDGQVTVLPDALPVFLRDVPGARPADFAVEAEVAAEELKRPAKQADNSPA